MSALHGIQLAIEQAQRIRDERARVVARLQAHLGSLRVQLQQLETYAVETEKRWIGGTHSQITGEMVRHHYQFMERLRHAMAMQTDVIAAALEDVANARRSHLQMEVRLQGLREVMNRRKQQVQRVVGRREQRQCDEFAALAHTRRVAVGEDDDDRDEPR